MEIDCPNCGSICDVVFEEDQTTETHPLFCPFCGENIDELFTEEDEDTEENSNYLDKLLEQDLEEDEDE
jgi:transcription elongation factor Elf1